MRRCFLSEFVGPIIPFCSPLKLAYEKNSYSKIAQLSVAQSGVGVNVMNPLSIWQTYGERD